jgi:hypothetical protein
MELLRWKARLSALWVFVAVSTSALMFLVFMMPGAIEEIMGGKLVGETLSEGMMVGYAFYWLVPLIMAVLCLTLNGSASRWLNFVLGIIWGLWFIAGIFEYMVMGDGGSVAVLLMFIAVVVASAFIAWFAWKLPQVET